MRFFPILAAALSLASFTFAQSPLDADEFDENYEQIVVESEDVEREFSAVGAWPDTNPFGRTLFYHLWDRVSLKIQTATLADVINGERNTIGVLVSNGLDRNVTLLNIAGALYQPDTGALVRNLTAMPYGIEMIEGLKYQLPFAFFSEFNPGELRLTVWVDHLDQGEVLRVIAFDSIIQVVEPEGSWFDFKLISTYLVVSGLVAGLGYVAYLSFVPQPKKKVRKPAVSAPVGTVTASGAGYQEEWIPSHHLKSRKKGGAVSSGDELSGGETSGTDGKKRKGKK
ncbi:hypothetical protein D9757_001491 [Collybiopsis confluens]|uniref:Signal sequence receptor subunit alpha n=1 Tax=Collybiopsis confluens TaxID=2823264 RepID=A0A8H5MFJ3_9AGAR|nr:hypothetical protein D9757_001491 [Collybiopsis confluens]